MSSAAAHRQLELEPRCEPELVDRVDVRRVGERDPEYVAVERVRERHDPLQDVKRDLSIASGDDADLDDVDVAEAVPGRRGRDATLAG